MSESCCELPPTAPARCPASQTPGTPVEWMTVAALTSAPVPPRQTFWLCQERSCEVVYFGEHGVSLTTGDLRVAPGFKDESDAGLLCYCFNLSGATIEKQLRTDGTTSAVEFVTAEVKAKNCACEVRNPSGKCCLGELRQGVKVIEARLSASASGRGD